MLNKKVIKHIKQQFFLSVKTHKDIFKAKVLKLSIISALERYF